VSSGRRQAGFTLVEMLISLALLMLVIALAAELMMESSQLLADSAAEQRDAPVPLIISRIRGDVLAASSFGGAQGRLLLFGHPQGTVQYEKVGDELRRAVVDDHDRLEGETIVWRQVEAWGWSGVGMPGASLEMLKLDVTYRRRTARSGLAVLPGNRRPPTELRTETLFLLPRGNGLGSRW